LNNGLNIAAWIAQPLETHSEALSVLLRISTPKASWMAFYIIGILVAPPTISTLWIGIFLSMTLAKQALTLTIIG